MPRRGHGESEHSPERLTAKERATRAMQLRKGGATYAAIAEALHFQSPQAAYDSVARGLRLMMQEPADELRKVEVQRLDALLLALWGRATGGDVQAINAVLRVMERRAALLGLDAPTRQEVTGAGGGPLVTQIIVADQETKAGVERMLRGERTEARDSANPTPDDEKHGSSPVSDGGKP